MMISGQFSRKNNTQTSNLQCGFHSEFRTFSGKMEKEESRFSANAYVDLYGSYAKTNNNTSLGLGGETGGKLAFNFTSLFETKKQKVTKKLIKKIDDAGISPIDPKDVDVAKNQFLKKLKTSFIMEGKLKGEINTAKKTSGELFAKSGIEIKNKKTSFGLMNLFFGVQVHSKNRFNPSLGLEINFSN